jgi:hypothetical protein
MSRVRQGLFKADVAFRRYVHRRRHPARPLHQRRPRLIVPLFIIVSVGLTALLGLALAYLHP